MKLPHISSKELIAILNKLGFSEVRQHASHRYMKHPDGRVTVVPVHNGRDIGTGLLRKIISEIEMERKDFLKFIRKK